MAFTHVGQWDGLTTSGVKPNAYDDHWDAFEVDGPASKVMRV